MLNWSPLSPLTVPNAPCSPLVECRKNASGDAENQPEARNDFLKTPGLACCWVFQWKSGGHKTKRFRRWRQVVRLEITAIVLQEDAVAINVCNAAT